MSDVVKGSSNIFEDLDFERQEAANLKIRADLMLAIKQFIQSQKWSQAEAARFFGETQPRISNLMNGDIDRFAIDKLVQMLSLAGMEVRLLVTPSKYQSVSASNCSSVSGKSPLRTMRKKTS